MGYNIQDKNDWITSIFISLVIVSIIAFACWIILDELSPSEDYVDCLHCNPDVLNQFSNPTFYLIPILFIILVLISLIEFIINHRAMGE